MNLFNSLKLLQEFFGEYKYKDFNYLFNTNINFFTQNYYKTKLPILPTNDPQGIQKQTEITKPYKQISSVIHKHKHINFLTANSMRDIPLSSSLSLCMSLHHLRRYLQNQIITSKTTFKCFKAIYKLSFN